MPPLKDEELGKKDDDHRISSRSRTSHSKMPRPRRFILGLIALVLVYEFFKHMPTDLKPARERYYPATARVQEQYPPPPPPPPPPPKAQPPPVAPQIESLSNSETENPGDKREGTYDGKIKVYELASSLPKTPHPENEPSHAVVFAGSSLPSITDMLPLACRMAREGRNKVHLVIMGKDEVSIEGIKKVNSIVHSECPMTWHDSRPDYASESTNSRMERSVKGGLAFIRTYIAPEAIITQGKTWEDSFFWAGLEQHLAEAQATHIPLPSASRDIMWLATVDSTALKEWNSIHVDIVVQASQSSGSLTRLLRSLDAADYLGSIPKLTVELPSEPETQTLSDFLGGLSQLKDQITLRRRIRPRFMNSAESSLRTVESFYPLEPKLSHLLILSPHVEVAPSFYHYLKYAILTYKYSAQNLEKASRLFGISLELPTSSPGVGNQPFSPPLGATKEQVSQKEPIPFFLWQAPNSNAALYFGDKWVEFHSFLSNRLDVSEASSSIPSDEKMISKRYPAFMEYMLELMRANGYYMAYPSFPGIKDSPLVKTHQDLYESPEEFSEKNPHGESEFADIEMVAPEKSLSRSSNIMTLFNTFEKGLPDIESSPLWSFDGQDSNQEKLVQQTKEYRRYFRKRYGGCPDEEQSPSDALFCTPRN